MSVVIALALLLFSGCAPQIGDACENDEDCPSGSICDRSVANGFCTILDCRPGDCPSESICVEFDRHTAYCMRSCSSDEECREDHQCIDDEELNQRYCFVAD